MTLTQKKDYLYDYCSGTCCSECKLIGYAWEDKSGIEKGCLNFDNSPESDINKALEIIGYVEKDDPVYHPGHYTDGKIETIEFIEDKKLCFCLGNAVKYISRAGKKDPTKEIEDLRKAIWYVERRIKQLGG